MNGIVVIDDLFHVYPSLIDKLSWHLDAFSKIFRYFVLDIVLVN